MTHQPASGQKKWKEKTLIWLLSLGENVSMVPANGRSPPPNLSNLQAPQDGYYWQNNSAVWSEKPFKPAAEGQDMTSYGTDKLQVLYCNI